MLTTRTIVWERLRAGGAGVGDSYRHPHGEPHDDPHGESGVDALDPDADPDNLPDPATSRAAGDFNLWLGHTNFTITRSVAEFISAEPGVEGFDVISRYRFRIVVGKVYAEAAVLRGVEQSLTRTTVGLRRCLDFLHSVVQTNWVLVVLEGGGSRYLESDRVGVLERAVANLKCVRHVYKSWSADCD